MPDIFFSIILIHVSHFNRPGERLFLLENCLDALDKLSYRCLEVVCVFDESTKGDFETLFSKRTDVNLIKHDGRIGVTAARNLGASRAKGKYLVFLDEDTKPEQDWLDRIKGAIESMSPSIAVYGSVEAPYEGPVKRLTSGSEGVVDILGNAYDEKVVQANIDESLSFFETLGFALAIEKDVFDTIGGFDERFGLFVPELDLCWRTRLLGRDVANINDAYVRHYRGITKKVYDREKVYLLERNTMMMLIKNYELKTICMLIPLFLLQCFLESFLFLFAKKPYMSFSVVRALWWNVANSKSNWEYHMRVKGFRKESDVSIHKKMAKINLRAFKFLTYLYREK